jgi:hypothetical protein
MSLRTVSSNDCRGSVYAEKLIYKNECKMKRSLSRGISRFACVSFFCLLFLSGSLFAQEGKLSVEVRRISEYLASDTFLKDRAALSDIKSLDLIFEKAAAVCKGDTTEALLAAMFACVPFNVVHAVTPVLGIKMDIPLFSAEKEVFLRKNKNLPRTFYLDSPTDPFGDKDKVAHFFGAAFLTYAMNSVELTIYIGYLVEIIESVLMVDPIDMRDVRTNALGAAFGRALRKQLPVKPSDIFLFSIIANSR